MKKRKSPKKGLQYETKSKPGTIHRVWSGKDKTYLQARKFARKFRYSLAEEMRDEGYMFKDVAIYDAATVIIKRDGRMTRLVIPFITSKHYRKFVTSVAEKIRDSFEKDSKE